MLDIFTHFTEMLLIWAFFMRRILCKYYMSGACKRGDSCVFSHDLTQLPNLVRDMILSARRNLLVLPAVYRVHAVTSLWTCGPHLAAHTTNPPCRSASTFLRDAVHMVTSAAMTMCDPHGRPSQMPEAHPPAAPSTNESHSRSQQHSGGQPHKAALHPPPTNHKAAPVIVSLPAAVQQLQQFQNHKQMQQERRQQRRQQSLQKSAMSTKTSTSRMSTRRGMSTTISMRRIQQQQARQATIMLCRLQALQQAGLRPGRTWLHCAAA